MKPLILLAMLLPFVAMAAENRTKPPLPKGDPVYMKDGEGWRFACWTYKGSKAIHGRLVGKVGEVFGKTYGEKVETGVGTLVWRGHYVFGKSPAKSTGWLFIKGPGYVFIGPDYTLDRYNPKTGQLSP